MTRVVRSRGEYPEQLLGVVAFGIVVGSMLPDIDFILTVPVVPFDRQLGEALHRSFTHSFVLCLPIAAAGAVLYRRNRERGLLVLGATAGMTLHVLQDFPFWFADVAALWPVFHVTEGSPGWLGIWGGYESADAVLSVLVAWESGSIVLYLVVLGAVAGRLGTDRSRQSRLRLWTGFYALAFLVSLALLPFFGLETYAAIVWAPSPLLWLLVVLLSGDVRPSNSSAGRACPAGPRASDSPAWQRRPAASDREQVRRSERGPVYPDVIWARSAVANHRYRGPCPPIRSPEVSQSHVRVDTVPATARVTATASARAPRSVT